MKSKHLIHWLTSCTHYYFHGCHTTKLFLIYRQTVTWWTVYTYVQYVKKTNKLYIWFSLLRALALMGTWRHLVAKVGTPKGREKQWQTTPKNLPRMQRARAIPVTWLGSGSCQNWPKGWILMMRIYMVGNGSNSDMCNDFWKNTYYADW
jgi:hypothetical protein